ncbi:hypothetical protein [Saccharothrix sp. HUAS TT1]|uniref:hypothetical protein n=1 Tax=unclassified Saccharothrix TaxID=2593673 RepID=UPI00345BA6C3
MTVRRARLLARRTAAAAIAITLTTTLCATAHAEDAPPAEPVTTAEPAEIADPVTVPVTQPATEPAAEPVTEPVSEPVSEPDTEPATPDPANTDQPATEDPADTNTETGADTGTPAGEQQDPEVEPAAEPFADPGVTAKVDGGPYLVGQPFPIDVTVTNHGTAEVTGLSTYTLRTSGSYVSLQWPLPDLPKTLAPGQSATARWQGQVYNWEGPPVFEVIIYSQNDMVWDNNRTTVAPLLTAPDAAAGSVSGLVLGERNGAREPIAGVQVRLNHAGRETVATTGADGRFHLADLPLVRYSVFFSRVPDGWVMPSNAAVEVDGDESVEYVAVRPLTDRFSASIAFTQDQYSVGDTAHAVVALTNSGTTDLHRITAFCDRSGGEGPHVVDLRLGALNWDASGVDVPAGQTVTVTVSGVVPPKAADFGSVSFGCTFGDDFYNERGFPDAYDLARVPTGTTHTWMRFTHDADEDTIHDEGEQVTGLTVRLVDWFSGQTAARGVTDATGRVDFTDLPAGPYWVEVDGPWRFSDWGELPVDRVVMHFKANCGDYCGGWYPRLVPWEDTAPGPEPTTPPAVPNPPAQAPAAPAAPVAPAAGGGAAAAALADTGVAPLGLMAVGVLALLAGAAAMVGGRRRRAA